MNTDTPETDRYTGLGHDIHKLIATSRRLEMERNELREAVRNMRDVAGRHHTEIACHRLYDLIRYNAAVLLPRGAGESDEGTNGKGAIL